ncbi:MAG TPA: NrfD/PsrC family molybdoenzyme membrane anchor subunit [Candidatus Udaeobacter sp.]|nr:NrfD/PsrC family molybdoenzyme membrane anchor subunit [Candidatus Udaeobacter sp.]
MKSENIALAPYEQINRDLTRTLEAPGRLYYGLLGIVLVVLGWAIFAWGYQLKTGLGVAGINHPVGWGVYITNFVFWVGIAHSGTLISAVLFLLRCRWRNSIARSAEAMTIFAVMTAGLFPIIHLGRPWYFYQLLPYPQEGQLWINFRSPLIWDVFAVGTYFTVSVLFFYTGLIPDLGTLRDRATGWKRKLYGFFACGWQGTHRQWRSYSKVYVLLAGFATPLVVSVHSVVSWDFAVSIMPGWHSTIFAPYFVAGAIHSGLAMVLTLIIPLRRAFELNAYISEKHLEYVAKLMIATGLILAYSYAAEFFIAWYSDNLFERYIYVYRATGRYAFTFWLMVLFNIALPLLFFAEEIRASTVWLFVISLLINIGMWLERLVIIVSSLSRDFLPSAWGSYRPTWVEVSITAGSFAWFFLWFLLFVKLLPIVSINEIKEDWSHSELKEKDER